MAKRHETVTLSDADIQEAIKDWLTKKYPDSVANPFNVSMDCHRSSSGYGWAEVDTVSFSVKASRDVE